MEIFVLVGHRKEAYEGQYAPEVLAAIDDVGNDDNPDYLRDEHQKQLASKDFSGLAIMTLRVPEQAVWQALYPHRTAVDAEVVAPGNELV